MTNRIPDFFQLDKYNITPEDVVRAYWRCDPDAIREDIVITPVWNQGFINHFPTVTTISDGRVYEARFRDQAISVVVSGIGAPQTGDVVLALGCTPCQRLIFTGSVGGFHPCMKVGDLLLTEESVSGEGFSRYLANDLKTRDSFLSPVQPDVQLTCIVRKSASRICEREAISLYAGRVVSVDSILGQFLRQEYLANELHCIGIEMETSAVFNAARLVGIKAAALLQVSDLPMAGKSLFSGRTTEEHERRRLIKKTILPEIVQDCLATASVS